MTSDARVVPAGAVERIVEVVAEHCARHDGAATFPTEALAALRSTGLLGLLVPTEFGGPGGGIRDLLDTVERLARTDLSVALVYAMHCQQVAAVVRYAQGRLRDELLPRIARGEVYLASVTTEQKKGGHLLTAESALAGADDGSLWIDRAAPVVTGARYADGFLITMRVPDATSPTQVSLVYGDRAQLTVESTGTWQPLGMRAVSPGDRRTMLVQPDCLPQRVDHGPRRPGPGGRLRQGRASVQHLVRQGRPDRCERD